MADFRLHHYVKNENGFIEMEIFANGNKFSVHFPRYEGIRTKYFRANLCFAEMKDYQVGMLIFAYSEKEFYRFREAHEKAQKQVRAIYASEYKERE